MPKKQVIVVLGQTATGKSNLAVKIALGHSHGQGKPIKGEIVSADSRQVYKGLNIGTGKITKKEMKGVPHHLLDVANPRDKFTVAEYQQKAIYAIADIIKRGKIPILCGGTGFYIDAITKGVVFPEVPPNLKLRKLLENKNEAELLKILKKLDKDRAKNIDVKNKLVFLRADLDVSVEDGKVANALRLEAWFPTFEYLIRNGAQVVIAGHLGRPEGVEEKYTLFPVAKWISEKINSKLVEVDLEGFKAWKLAENVFVLENLS
jgi:tRNA dimethylallyltransferase